MFVVYVFNHLSYLHLNPNTQFECSPPHSRISIFENSATQQAQEEVTSEHVFTMITPSNNDVSGDSPQFSS